LSENRFRSFTNEGSEYTGNHLPGIPRSQVHSELIVRLPHQLKFNIVYRYTGSQFADDANTVVVAGWNTVDAGLRYDGTWTGKLVFNTSLSVQNIFNEQYASMILINAPTFAGRAPRYFYPALPRNFAFKVQVNW
jgi:iron complex outermembrane receptor protein